VTILLSKSAEGATSFSSPLGEIGMVVRSTCSDMLGNSEGCKRTESQMDETGWKVIAAYQVGIDLSAGGIEATKNRTVDRLGVGWCDCRKERVMVNLGLSQSVGSNRATTRRRNKLGESFELYVPSRYC
jgi:hypothetical protein